MALQYKIAKDDTHSLINAVRGQLGIAFNVVTQFDWDDLQDESIKLIIPATSVSHGDDVGQTGDATLWISFDLSGTHADGAVHSGTLVNSNSLFTPSANEFGHWVNLSGCYGN